MGLFSLHTLASINDALQFGCDMTKRGANGKVNWLDNSKNASLNLFANTGATINANAGYKATGCPLGYTAKFAAGNNAAQALNNTAQMNYQLWQMYQPPIYDQIYANMRFGSGSNMAMYGTGMYGNGMFC